MNKKRFNNFARFIYFCFSILLVVIFNISVINNESYVTKAVYQRAENLYEVPVRGTIYDKNMIPFVNGRTYETLSDNIKHNAKKRYDDLSLARHLIGYTDLDFNGISGLEKEYDVFLKTDKKFTISKISDVFDNTIKNMGTRILNDSESESNLKLTLDYHIQKIVEDEMDKSVVKGSVAIIDVNTFDALALCSRPDFDQRNVGGYIENNGTELVDRVMSQYNAGSIFKIITTAAAIEENEQIKDEIFLCTGNKNIEGVIFNCHKMDGHMFLNLNDAFESSCNCAYYEIAMRIGCDKILKMAKRFKIGEKLLNLSWENSGNILTEKTKTNADAANIAIGQGDVLLTPLQACYIAGVIANDGVGKKINVVSSIVDNDGKEIFDLKTEKEEQIIKKSTADLIKVMMRGCVENGTGKSANSDKVNVSGKTGTAETGWMEDDSFMVHGWFTGFFPSENPKYAMSVFLENGKSSKNAAIVFKNIAEKIMELNG